jgi:hypothetical protein
LTGRRLLHAFMGPAILAGSRHVCTCTPYQGCHCAASASERHALLSVT